MKSNQPLISVVMPVFNGASYLKEAIESILGQTHAHFELIIMDDGSTDNSLPIAHSYTDERIKVVHDGVNKGAYFRLNEGVAIASGAFVAIMDGDDIALPTRLERQVKFLVENSGVDFCGTQVKLLVEPDKTLETPKDLALSDENIKAFSLFFCPFIHPTVMYKAEVVKAHPYTASSTMCEDYVQWMHLLERYRGANLDEVHLHYRRHGGNTSSHVDEDALKGLFLKQFERIGISPSPDELETHFLLSDSNAVWLSEEQLEHIRNWLGKLAEFNRHQNIFDRAYFEELLKVVYIEAWLWKVKDLRLFFRKKYCPIFYASTTWPMRWKLLRIFVHRIRYRGDAGT